MKAVRWLLPLASLALVLVFTWRDFRGARSAPGPLHPAHAALASLEGGARCEACHREGAVDPDGCHACHAAIAAQAAGHRGLHGSLPPDQFARCGTCHPDHLGTELALLPPFAFARVGIDDPSTYDHRHVAAFGLGGAHAQLVCGRCHLDANAEAPPAGGRFLGLSQDCATCHQDVHAGAFGGACATCHGQEQPFAAAPGFVHARFALRDAHAKVGCAACHPAGTELDVTAERATPQPMRTCAACHADPHGSGVQVAALRLADTADCGRCHAPSEWRSARFTPADHADSGFPLHGEHAKVACATCHGDATTAARWSGAPPALAACAACHVHPHTAALVGAATSTQGPADGCAGCHAETQSQFADGSITVDQHAATGFPLTPPHADARCTDCHRGTDRAARYPGRSPADCRACHADVHRGQFDHEARFAQCTVCHQATAFTPHRFGPELHATTTFALTGAHDAVACVACHREVRDGVRTFAGTASECSACHADVHGGLFDRRGAPAEVGGERGCARCHDTVAFAPVRSDFDHARWTGYPLEGVHAAAACVACHQLPRKATDGGIGGARLGLVPGRRCGDCHADPHAGQFGFAGRTDCTRCHGQQGWTPSRFDHGRDSRFALDATHAKLACAQCHVGRRDPVSAQTIVRFKPLGTKCGDCHKLGTGGGVVPREGAPR